MDSPQSAMVPSKSLTSQDLRKFTFQFSNFDTQVEPLFQRLVEEGRFDKVHKNSHWNIVGRRKGDKANVRFSPLEGKSLGQALYGVNNTLLQGMQADYQDFHHPLQEQIWRLEKDLKDAVTVLADDDNLEIDRKKLEERISYIYTLMRSLGDEHAQSAHFDFPFKFLETLAKQLLLVFFPLTPDGCQLHVWTTGVPDDGDDVRYGVVYHIPYGSFLVLPPGSIHGGGFSSNMETGNPRAHVYVVTGDADLGHKEFKNEHYSQTTGKQLSLRFLNDPSFHPQMSGEKKRSRPAKKRVAAARRRKSQHGPRTVAKSRSTPHSLADSKRIESPVGRFIHSEQVGRRPGSTNLGILQSGVRSSATDIIRVSPHVAPLATEVIVKLTGDGVEDARPLLAVALSNIQSGPFLPN